MRAPFGVKGGKNILFRNNTVVGDLPSLAYVMRLNSEGSNPPNENIQFFNNIWSDTTGTMGAENPSRPNDFSDTPQGQTVSFQLQNNLFWNGGGSIPFDSNELINYTEDTAGMIDDPNLPEQTNVMLPRWNPNQGRFVDGSLTIRQAFERLVITYGVPTSEGPTIDTADPSFSPSEDILGNPRPIDATQDIGAVEFEMLSSLPGDLNLDGLLTREDVQLCVRLILRLENYAGLSGRADLNQDGVINVLDLQALINIVVSADGRSIGQ